MKKIIELICSAVTRCRDCGATTDAYGSRCESCGSSNF